MPDLWHSGVTHRNLKPKFSESYGYSARLNVNGSFGNAQAGLN